MPAKEIRRWHIINHLIQVRGYKKYLELGSIGRMDNREHNFRQIEVADKTGIDRKGSPQYKMTTDEFFRQLPSVTKYDIVFVDAQHIKAFVDRDIANALEHLEPGGVVVVHDCNPLDSRATVQTIVEGWNGDVWKSIVELRCTRNHLEIYTVDVDWGCGVIQRGWQDMYSEVPLCVCLTWDYFRQHKKALLNLISTKEFFRRIDAAI